MIGTDRAGAPSASLHQSFTMWLQSGVRIPLGLPRNSPTRPSPEGLVAYSRSDLRPVSPGKRDPAGTAPMGRGEVQVRRSDPARLYRMMAHAPAVATRLT